MKNGYIFITISKGETTQIDFLNESKFSWEKWVIDMWTINSLYMPIDMESMCLDKPTKNTAGKKWPLFQPVTRENVKGIWMLDRSYEIWHKVHFKWVHTNSVFKQLNMDQEIVYGIILLELPAAYDQILLMVCTTLLLKYPRNINFIKCISIW